MKLIDESICTTRQSYTITRIYHITHSGGVEIIRIAVHRDFYAQQSHARGCVLTPAKTWTRIIENPAFTWHRQTPTALTEPRVRVDALYAMIDVLAQRAAAVLGYAVSDDALDRAIRDVPTNDDVRVRTHLAP